MEDLKREGYNKEEEYFYNLNKKLIEQKRAEMAKENAETAKGAYWMVCPKCGGKMNEINKAGIMIDECSGCGGVYFDRGELDILLESKESGGFFGLFRKKK